MKIVKAVKITEIPSIWVYAWNPKPNLLIQHKVIKQSSYQLKEQSIVWLKQRAVHRKSAKSGPDGHWFKFHSPHPPTLPGTTEIHSDGIFGYQVTSQGVRYKPLIMTIPPPTSIPSNLPKEKVKEEVTV